MLEHVEVIVRPFSTIHDRPAFNGYSATVGFNLVVGFDCAGLHVEVEFNLVALLPVASDGVVAVGSE